MTQHSRSMATLAHPCIFLVRLIVRPLPHSACLRENSSYISSSPVIRWDACADLCEKASGLKDWVLLQLTERHRQADRCQATCRLTNLIRGPFVCSVFLFLERKRCFTISEVMLMTRLTHELLALFLPTIHPSQAGGFLKSSVVDDGPPQINQLNTSSLFSITDRPEWTWNAERRRRRNSHVSSPLSHGGFEETQHIRKASSRRSAPTVPLPWHSWIHLGRNVFLVLIP